MPKRKTKKTSVKPQDDGNPRILDKLHTDYYTTEQVARAVGRNIEHWCRIRQSYVVKYRLQVIKIGRRNYYKKDCVDRMLEDVLKNGD